MKPLPFLLNYLTEEAGEILQVIGKINRFGIESRRPGETDGEPNPTNLQNLVTEINDFVAGVEMLNDMLRESGHGEMIGLFNREKIEARKEKFEFFAAISARGGFLEDGDVPVTVPAAEFQNEP